jgi:hypothetical protein
LLYYYLTKSFYISIDFIYYDKANDNGFYQFCYLFKNILGGEEDDADDDDDFYFDLNNFLRVGSVVVLVVLSFSSLKIVVLFKLTSFLY